MKNKKRIVPLSLLLMSILVGCNAQQQIEIATEPTASICTTGAIVTTDPTVETTLSSHTMVTVPPTTAATEPAEETTVPTQPERTKPPATEPVQSSQPTDVEPVVTQPTETVPPVTEPAEQEKLTEPVPTEPAPTVHQHSYSTEVVKATCTAPGYTVHTCKCSDSYTDSQTPAIGHTYTATVTAPTTQTQGYTTYTCMICSDSYIGNYTDALAKTEIIDIDELINVGLNYAAETYGYEISKGVRDGYYPAYTCWFATMESGHQEIQKCVDDTTSALLARPGAQIVTEINGEIYRAMIDIVITSQADGSYKVCVYYG